MDEYIKREYAIDAVLDVYYDTPDIDLSGEKFEAAILKIPIADVATVVRCKDCKYHGDEEIGMVYCPNMIGGWVAENWFCADGERKEGDD